MFCTNDWQADNMCTTSGTKTFGGLIPWSGLQLGFTFGQTFGVFIYTKTFGGRWELIGAWAHILFHKPCLVKNFIGSNKKKISPHKPQIDKFLEGLWKKF